MRPLVSSTKSNRPGGGRFMKTCRACGRRKGLDSFQKETGCKSDGRRGTCKDCENERRREVNRRNPELAARRNKRYRKSHPEDVRRRKREWEKKSYKETYKRNRHKFLARVALRYAVRVGKVQKLPCQACGDPNSQGHHHKGYAPEHRLDVIWLCQTHHLQEHGVQEIKV